MKKLAISIATIVFAGSVSASDESFIYHGFEVNNPDLYAGYAVTEQATAALPGIGDNRDHSRAATAKIQDSYETFVMNNPANYSGLSKSSSVTAMSPQIGDSTNRTQQSLLMRRDSYDAWVEGNPDQASSF